MAINTNWKCTDNKLGANFNKVISVNTDQDEADFTPEYPSTPLALGERAHGDGGSEWIFVQASTTVSQYMAVVIDANFKANNLTSALIASNVYAIGLAQFSDVTCANAGEYFWALLKANGGGAAANVSPSAGRGVALYISSNAGMFTSSATTNRIAGISFVASIGTSASNPGEVIIYDYMHASA